MTTQFRSNMRVNWRENRYDPYTYAGGYGFSRTYDKAVTQTARAALHDAGMFKIDAWKMKVANPYTKKWEAATERMLVSIPSDISHVSGWNDNFLGVVSEDYRPLQPEWIATLWDEYVRDENGNPVPVTGIRMDKRRSHMVISSEIFSYDVKGFNGGGRRSLDDQVKSYMILDVPFTPGNSVKLSAGDLRLICLNGATRDDARKRISIPHIGDPEEVIRKVICNMYGYSLEQAAKNEELYSKLAKHVPNNVEIQWILDTVLPIPEQQEANELDPRSDSRVKRTEQRIDRTENWHADIITMISGAAIGSDLPTATYNGKPTLWGVVNGFSNFMDAKRSNNFEKMTYDFINGDRAKMVGDVIEQALAIVDGTAPEFVYA